MSSPPIPAALLDAVMFAAKRHKNQRRKDEEASPYINHPLALAHLLATTGGVEDVATLQAAILHDTIEDTETTEEELRLRFGGEVADIVVELTDDKSLPKQRRKKLQVENAPQKSNAAALVKLADKTCNLRDIANTPPAGWTIQRRQEYFDWAKLVVEGLPKVSEPLLAEFLAVYAHRPMNTMPVGPTDREASWLSMPGALRGTSGFVRALDSGAIEVELYDHSEAAHSAFGGDVSTVYTVSKTDLSLLAQQLAVGFGGETPGSEELLERLTTFLDVQSLIGWLTNDSGVDTERRVHFNV